MDLKFAGAEGQVPIEERDGDAGDMFGGIGLDACCAKLRKEIKENDGLARTLVMHPAFKNDQEFPGQHGEMAANIKLAVRHLEDARLRLGEVVRWANDAKGCVAGL